MLDIAKILTLKEETELAAVSERFWLETRNGSKQRRRKNREQGAADSTNRLLAVGGRGAKIFRGRSLLPEGLLTLRHSAPTPITNALVRDTSVL